MNAYELRQTTASDFKSRESQSTSRNKSNNYKQLLMGINRQKHVKATTNNRKELKTTKGLSTATKGLSTATKQLSIATLCCKQLEPISSMARGDR